MTVNVLLFKFSIRDVFFKHVIKGCSLIYLSTSGDVTFFSIRSHLFLSSIKIWCLNAAELHSAVLYKLVIWPTFLGQVKISSSNDWWFVMCVQCKIYLYYMINEWCLCNICLFFMEYSTKHIQSACAFPTVLGISFYFLNLISSLDLEKLSWIQLLCCVYLLLSSTQ